MNHADTHKMTVKELFFGGIAVVVIALLLIFTPAPKQDLYQEQSLSTTPLEEQVLPQDGVVLPIAWGDIGVRMVESGVIDIPRLEALYARRGGLSIESTRLLSDPVHTPVVITQKNSQELLNLFWAFGLSNKNEILEQGPMTEEQYGGDPSRFASTGGWSLAVGDSMQHYSAHQFITLTSKQQKRVEKVAQGVYRPCCNNSTYFPDCNHGMAMLGLLELMASQGVAEQDMWEIALAVNSYWFPDTYLTIATYMKDKDIDWADAKPQEILSADFSSASGFRKIAAQVTPPEQKGGGGCSV